MSLRKGWTPEEDAILLELIRNNKSSRVAAMKLGRTRNSCISRTRILGKKFPPKPNAPRIKWTQDEDNRLENLISEGKTVNQAATILLTSGPACSKRAKKLGLKFKELGTL